MAIATTTIVIVEAAIARAMTIAMTTTLTKLTAMTITKTISIATRSR